MSNIVTKTISVKKGEEYKVCSINMAEEGNFFYDVYLKAKRCVDEIQSINTEIARSSDPDMIKPINNIIAFCGERGQGKTSAMLSFSDILSNSFPKKYRIMNVIDPTNLEKNDNILMLILSCIFREFKEAWKKTSNNGPFRESKKNNILDLFQKAYHHISTIKASGKSDNTADFDDVMNLLDKYGDSTNLRNVFCDLIREFLEFIEYDKDSFFVIQIDDTDLNVERAYEIIEDIRKYLSIPNVIVLMATKFEQLSKIIEQNYINNFKVLYEKNEINNYEVSSMASKYLEKLIPETRRIYLPSLNMGDLSAEMPQINYTDKNNLPIIDVGNIQEQLIKLIDRKIGISFDISNLNGIIHPIIPRTMRELVNFLALLSNMEDVKDHSNNMIKGVDDKSNSKQREVLYNNINTFYDYFKTNWIESHFDNDDINRLGRIIDAKINTTHMQTLLEIQDKVMRLDNSIKNIKIKYTDIFGKTRSDYLIERINAIISDQTESNPFTYSLGNIMDALIALNKSIKSNDMINFTFAIKTIYTMKMMIFAINDLIIANNNKNDQFRWSNASVGYFIGTDFIGKYCVSELFPYTASSRICRGRFNISIADYENQLRKQGVVFSKLDEIIDKNYLKYFVFLGYLSSDFDYTQTLSQNNVPFTTLYFNISYFFICMIREGGKEQSNLIFQLLNFENIFNIITDQLKRKDTIKGKADLANFLKGFFEKFKQYGFNFDIDILKEIDDNTAYLEAFDSCFKLQAEKHRLKSKKISNFFGRNPQVSEWNGICKYFENRLKESEDLSEDDKPIIINLINDELSKYQKEKALTEEAVLNGSEKTDLRNRLNKIIETVTSPNQEG